MNASDRKLLKQYKAANKPQSKSDKRHARGVFAAIVLFFAFFAADVAYFSLVADSGETSGAGLRGLGYLAAVELLAVVGAYRFFTR